MRGGLSEEVTLVGVEQAQGVEYFKILITSHLGFFNTVCVEEA